MSLKYTLILIVACLPLAGLTVASVVQSIGQDSLSVLPRYDSQEAQALADEAAGRAAGDGPSASQWIDLDPFDPRARTLAEAKSDSARQIVEAWLRAQTASDVALKAAQAAASAGQQSDDSLARVTQRLAALQTAVNALRVEASGKIAAADELLAALDRRVERLTQQKKDLEVQDKIDEALAPVEKLLKARTPDGEAEALRLLDEEPLKSARDPRQRARIDQLKQTADYRLRYRDLYKRQPSPAADRNLLREYGEFFRLHPDPPSNVEKEAHENLSRRRAELQAVVALDDLELSPDLQSLMAAAARLTRQREVDAAAKARVREHVEHWLLTMAFPEKRPPDSLLGKEEGITKAAQRYVGYFLLPPGVTQWRYWETEKQKNDTRRGIEQIATSDFEKLPGSPMYVQLAEDYNAQRQSLMNEGASKERWESFARRCDEMEAELIAYRRRWGVTQEMDKACREWTFKPQAKAAREITDQWENYRSIFEK